MQPHPVSGLTPPSGEPEKKKKGRPKGAKNKASGDLGKAFVDRAGATPGEQLIDLTAVSPKDVRLAKVWAKEKATVIRNGEVVDLRAIPDRWVALTWRAHNLAMLNNWDIDRSWAILMKGHDMMLPYVHQKQGSVEAVVADKRGVIMVDDAPLGSLGNPSQVLDAEQEITFGPMTGQGALTHSGSHIEPES